MSTTWLATDLLPGVSGQGDVKAAAASETRLYQVQFSDAFASSFDAILATNIPAYGAQLTTALNGSPNLFVSSKKATQDLKRRDVWIVEVVYSTIDPNRPQPAPAGFTSGDKFNVQTRVSAVTQTEDVQVDATGKPCVNTNGEPVAIVANFKDREIHVTFQTDKLPQTVIDACIECCNSSTVSLPCGSSSLTLSAGTLKLDDYSYSNLSAADGNKFLSVDYTFLARIDGWDIKIPNESYYSSTAAGLVPFRDALGQPCSTPRFIDSSGKLIGSGSSAYMLTFRNVPLVDFTELLLQIS